MAKVAFITGGNGITGLAVLEYLVRNTKPDEWSQFIVASRSPFKTVVHDSRITFIPLDFSEDVDRLIEKMRADDFKELNTANEKLFSNFLYSLLAVAPRLENCTLQTGGKHYNVHLMPVPSPAREEDDPRRDSPIGNFYYQQEDYLIERQREPNWTWNVIRPEAIIGYASKPNGMNSALTFALYLLVCKELGEEAKMPTNARYWAGYDDLSDSRLIADMTIWASTRPKTGNQAFNVANGDYFSWRYMWPRLAAYIGARASSEQKFSKPPLPATQEGDVQLDTSFADWAKDKKGVWDCLCDKRGCPDSKQTWDAGTWAYQDWVFQRTWSATLSINKARKFRLTGHLDSSQSLTGALDKFVELKQIPPFR